MQEVPMPHEGKSREQQAYDIAVWNMRGRQSSPARNRMNSLEHPAAFTAARTRAATPRQPANVNNTSIRSTRKLILAEDSYPKDDAEEILQLLRRLCSNLIEAGLDLFISILS